MKILNLGCGSCRPQGPEFTNLDDLHWQLPPGTGARLDLDAEPNYINFEIGHGPLPFEDDQFDGILASHFFEHFDAQAGLAVMIECRRILKPGGSLLVSVPNVSYFCSVYERDRNENWPELFDVTDPANPIPTFFQAALWFEQHKMQFTEDALWAFFTRAGLLMAYPSFLESEPSGPLMLPLLNRRKFSLEFCGVKP